MKALLLNGAKAGDDAVDRAGGTLTEELQARGWAVDTLTLRELKIAPCSGCFGCWTKTPGRCPTEDASQMVARLSVHCDLLALLTPVTFGGYSSELKKALDRIICIALPFFRKVDGEVHHQLRYDQRPNLLALGMVDEPDEESERVFQTLVSRNALNFASPAHVAGTVRKDLDGDLVRQQVRGLLARLEAGV
jgi:multimeric flavodoxin WrbA